MKVAEFNRPEIVAEVRAAFERYEALLIAHDVEALNDCFARSAQLVRYGIEEHALGYEAVVAYRRRATRVDVARQLSRTVILTVGADAASVSTEFTVPPATRIGRQTQMWVRTAEGWKIAAAHISEVDASRLRRD